ARVVVGRKNKWMQRRHLAGVERAPKLRCFSFLFRTVSVVALDSVAQRSFDRRKNSVTPFCILLTLLIIIEPERRINADEHQQQFRDPTAEPRETRTLFSCFGHG